MRHTRAAAPVGTAGVTRQPFRLVSRYRPIAGAALLLVVALVDAWLLGMMATEWTAGWDAYAAYVLDLAQPWAGAEESMTGVGVFRWSPVAAQVLAPFGALPWDLYMLGFLGLQLAAIYAMAGPRWPYVVLFPPVLVNLWFMNIDLLVGAAIVASFRWPGFWAVAFLGKVTPGVGVLWFAFRREWRSFGLALGTTALVVGCSFALAPHLWFQWFDALRAMSALPQSSLGPPLPVRLALAVVVVWHGARTDRRWLVPVACVLAIPNLWLVTLAGLGAGIALYRQPVRTASRNGVARMARTSRSR